MSAPLLIIAAGGTGGHMFPAQSLAEEMLSRGWRVKLATDARGARYAGGFPDAVTREVLNSGSFAQGSKLARLLVPFRVLTGAIGAIRAMKKDRPACVIGFGGYPALPAMIGATWLKLPRMIHEQNGVLGRVNQLFAKRVDAVACGTWPTELPDGVTGHDIGNPVRTEVNKRAGAPYITPGDWPMDLLVFGGSQGAHVMTIVPKALKNLPEEIRARLTVSHQARAEDHEAMEAAYGGLGIREAVIKPFFDDMADRLAKAQLVICRAGASSVADLCVIGRPSILIPLAIAKRDEQTANAAGLVANGGAKLITEADLTPEVLAAHITAIFNDPDAARASAHAALALGKPDAAERLADLVTEISGQEPT